MATTYPSQAKRRGCGLVNPFPTNSVPPSSNLWGWWDAAQAYTDAGKTTLCSSSGSDTCYTLADRSGNGRDMVQGTAGSRPTWYSSQLNGYPSLRFDGSNDYMNTASDAMTANISFFLVFRNITWTVGDYIFGRKDVSSTCSLLQSDTTPEIRQVGPGVNNANLSVNTFGAVHVAYNSTTTILKVNNTTSATGSFAVSPPTGIELASIGGGTGACGNIDFCEMIAYHNTTISDGSETQKSVMNYLSSKYNLGWLL